MKEKKTTTNAVKILHKRYIHGNKKRLESLQRERENLALGGGDIHSSPSV